MLIIALPQSSDASTDYTYVHSDGPNVLRMASSSAGALPTNTDEVVAVVPHNRLAWLRVQLPPASHGPRLQSVLHGLLEERLLDDLQQLHIVLDPEAAGLARIGGDAWVTVCDKQWLRDVLAPLKSANIIVQRIVPELSPSTPSVLQAMGLPGNLQYVLCHTDGVTLLPPNTAQWHAFPDLNQDDLQIQAEPTMATHMQNELQRQPLLQSAAQRWVKSAESSWNLAQGEWAQGHTQRLERLVQSAWQTIAHTPAWRSVRWGILVLITLQVLGLNALAWRENGALNARQAALQNILTTTFPSVTLVIDAPFQMQREVDALRQKSGLASSTDFEPLLSVLASLLPQGQTPQQIHFANHALRVQGVTLDTNMTTHLKTQGFSLRQEGNDTWVLQAEGLK